MPSVRLWWLGPTSKSPSSLHTPADIAGQTRYYYRASALDHRIHQLLDPRRRQSIVAPREIPHGGHLWREMEDGRKPQCQQPLTQGLRLEAREPGFAVGRGEGRIERGGLQVVSLELGIRQDEREGNAAGGRQGEHNWRVAAMASDVRYWVTPNHTKNVGTCGSNATAPRPSWRDVRSKSRGQKVTLSGMATPACPRRSRLNAWDAG